MSLRGNLIVALLIVCSGALSLSMVWTPTHQDKHRSIYDLGYWVGPTTHSLLEGRGLLVCDEKMGPPGSPLCFHSARMPVASNVLAAGVMLFGDRPKPIDAAKTLVFMIPLWVAMAVVMRTAYQSRAATMVCAALLLLPSLIVSLLVVTASMEVEEGYLYGLLTLALVLVIFPLKRSAKWAVMLSLILAVTFLSKSSMLPAVGVLLLAELFLIRSWRLRAIATVLVALAPVSWIIYQHHASGRYSVGTSVDGMNLHKGNNADFQERYPSSNGSFDSFDVELNSGRYFRDEWAFNDYHMHEGRQFAFSHPAFTIRSIWKKFSYLLFSFDPYIATVISPASRSVALLGIVIFRMLLWTALALSVVGLVTGTGVHRFGSLIYLLFVGAYCLPYLLGFGFMRHAVILAYPSTVFCCLVACSYFKEKVSSGAPPPRHDFFST